MKNPKPKKLSFAILDILRQYTDSNPEHRLNQNDIIEILERDYDIKADRKSVKRNLTSLWEMGFLVEWEETRRMYPNKEGEMEESFIQHDFYLDRDPEKDFDDSELRLLIDSLLFSKHVPYSQCRKLVGKLKGLSNNWFKSRIRFISKLPETVPENTELFYTIDVLDEAIAENKQVAFTYNKYGTDKKLHPRREQEYIVNPYQMAATNGRYYLICNYDKYDNVANYRLDRITDIKLLDTPVKPKSKVTWLEHGLDLPRHMAEHIYMFTGESVSVTFRAKKYILNEVIDWLGRDIEILSETEEDFTARVRMNYEAMRCWALQYARHVRVLTPQKLVEQIKTDLRQSVENYED